MFRKKGNKNDPEYSVNKFAFPENLYSKLLELVRSLNGVRSFECDMERIKIENKVYRDMKYCKKI